MVDDSGSYQSHVTAKYWQHENTFGVDLNGDLTIGLRTIEDIGDVHLALGDNKHSGDTKYYIVDGIKDPIALTKAGREKGPTDGAGSVTQVEKVGTDMRCFGPVTVADLKCGRLMIQAAISPMLLLNIGNMRIRSELISMGI